MIYLTGDTHGDIDISKLGTKQFPQGKELTKDDYVVILGDFGNVWDNGPSDRYWQKWLADKPFTTLFIDGNHENHELLSSYGVEEWNGGKVHRINDSLFHLMRGQVFELDGKKIFTFGGGLSEDKEQRTEGISWWPGEMPTQKEYEEGRKNLDAHGWTVDYVFTHSCPTSIQKKVNEQFEKDKTPNELTDELEEIKKKLTYNHWYFGHNHRDADLDDKHTILYNTIRKL